MRRLGIGVCLLLGLLACGDGPDAEEDVPVIPSGAVAMEAIVVLGSGPSMQLFDPSTGLTSPVYTVAPAGFFSPVAVAPDGGRIAYSTPMGIALAEILLSESGPELSTLAEWDYAALNVDRIRRLGWSRDGERLVYDASAGDIASTIDIASGDVSPCALSGGMPRPPAAVCDGAPSWRERASLVDSSSGFSADGQLAGASYHVPTGTSRDVPVVFLGHEGDVVSLGTGEYAQFPGGVHGDFLQDGRRMTLASPPRDGAMYSPHEVFSNAAAADAEPPAPSTWPLAQALTPYFDQGTGRRYSLVGTTADGERAVYRVNSHVIETDSEGNLFERSVAAALVEIARDGEARGYRADEVGIERLVRPFRTTNEERYFQPDILDPLGLVALGNQDFIAPGSSGNVAESADWAGRIDGQPWAAAGAGTLSPDGRWFASTRRTSTGLPFAVCMTPVEAGASTECIEPLNDALDGSVLTFAGYGTKTSFSDDPPRITSVSRSAAWNGSVVTMHGVRFGSGGTLRVGDATVNAANVVEWSDRRVSFRMNDALPEAGALSLTSDAGSTDGGRAFWLHRTPALSTPFDEIPDEALALGQGLNFAQLGDLTGLAPIVGNSGPIRLTEELRAEDGRYVVVAAFAGPLDGHTLLQIGTSSKRLFYRFEERLADASRWQVVSRLQGFTPGGGSTMTHIAGDLATLGLGGQHPYAVGERVAFANPSSRLPGTLDAYQGVPDFWRERPDGESAWVVVKYNNYQYQLLLQTGWLGMEGWGRATHAETPRPMLPGITSVEAAGDTVIATGQGLSGAGFALSTDGGLTFAPPVSVGDLESRLGEPIRVESAAETFFVVMESPTNAPGLNGIHAVTTDGTFRANVAALPDGQLEGGLATSGLPVQYATRGGELVVYFPITQTLVRTDFDVGTDETRSWTTLPSPEWQGRVVSFYTEQGSPELVAVLDDGGVMRASSDWNDWSDWDLGVDLALPTRAQPLALGRLEDGRWMVHAELFDGRVSGETPSPIATEAYLVSPSP